MLANIKIFTKDVYWRSILSDIGAEIVDSQNLADVVFDDIDIKTPIDVSDLVSIILSHAENADVIYKIFGGDVVLPALARKIIIALYKNPNVSMRELKDLIGVLPDVSSHAVENAIYQLRKNYGHDIIQNKDGKYKIGNV